MLPGCGVRMSADTGTARRRKGVWAGSRHSKDAIAWQSCQSASELCWRRVFIKASALWATLGVGHNACHLAGGSPLNYSLEAQHAGDKHF